MVARWWLLDAVDSSTFSGVRNTKVNANDAETFSDTGIDYGINDFQTVLTGIKVRRFARDPDDTYGLCCILFLAAG